MKIGFMYFVGNLLKFFFRKKNVVKYFVYILYYIYNKINFKR